MDKREIEKAIRNYRQGIWRVKITRWNKGKNCQWVYNTWRQQRGLKNDV
jgi:hypothetical protein